MKLNSSPAADGYVLAADFDHKATMVLFPYREDVWCDIAQSQRTHLELIEKMSQYERVYVGARREEMEMLKGLRCPNVVLFELEQDDAWIRDSGPLFVKKGNDIRMIKNGFNAWGGLYDDWSHDVKITDRLSGLFHCDYYENNFIMEGGNITTDGKGTAILVENCIVNVNRNTSSKEELEQALKSGLGLKRIIWLEQGFVNDETGGHIDNVCRFLPDGSVVISWTDDKNHPMYDRCREIEERLCKEAPSLPIKKLITPAAQYRESSESIERAGAMKRLPKELLTASYINYYETDRAVFIPQFKAREDEIAERQFKELFPGRKIIPIYTRDYILAGGGLHCLTLGVDFKEKKI